MAFTFNINNLPRTLSLEREGDSITLRLVDQRQLPASLEFIEARTSGQVVDAIKTLAVRGAPALGVAGAAALCLWVCEIRRRGKAVSDCASSIDDAARTIATARPTAVNLSWGVTRALGRAKAILAEAKSLDEVVGGLFDLVKGMEAQDEACNRAIGAHGATLLRPESRVLTHCNAGSLATVFFGTALGVVYAAAEQGKIKRVYADETRPVGQGARLTAWELARAGVPVTLLCDNMAASLMQSGAVDAVIVGADRIAVNGDTANKIGTYGLAVLAHEHGVPFYVAAPLSTIDGNMPTGDGIPIEQRAAREVAAFDIPGVDIWNPAFDVTPARFITRVITEVGVCAPHELNGLLQREE